MHRRALLAALALPHFAALGNSSTATSALASSASAPAIPSKRGQAARSGQPSGATRTVTVSPSNLLAFPADHGAHPDARIEWWYLTGWLQPADAAVDSGKPPNTEFGFQLTFFRSRTGIGEESPSRFAPRQLIFAHAAVSHCGEQRLRLDQGIARAGFGIAEASEGDTQLRLRNWQLERTDDLAQPTHGASVYQAQARGEESNSRTSFGFDLSLRATQPILLQGLAGYSSKGPSSGEASHYVTEPQLRAQGRLQWGERNVAVIGQAWLDHEWSDSLLAPDAVGWDWIGINLFDGSALTAFVIRRADGGVLYAGGSFRARRSAARNFSPTDITWTPQRRWRSTATGASYPVEVSLRCPAGNFRLRALFDAQELDARRSTGAVYWEGLSELLSEAGDRLGLGYLEMTGYASPLRL